MSTHTVPTPAPEPSQPPRVAPCDPVLEEDLGSIFLECDCRRRTGVPWLHTHIDYGLTEAKLAEQFAAHRAECEARD